MGRAKLRTELITEEKKRNTTYRNRKNGIIKKAKELSVLCDVDTAIIVCPPASNQPEIWPQDPHQIKNMIRSYKQEKGENRKRTYDLNDYFQDRKRKIEDELVRARERNMEAKYPTWFDELNGLSEGQLRQFAIELENKTNTVKAHLESKKRNLNVQIENNQPLSSHLNVGSLDQVQTFNHDNDLLMSQWFDDLPDLFENNHPSVGSYPSLDQVEAFNPGDDLLMSQWFDDDDLLPDLQMPFEDNQPSNPDLLMSLDQVQALNPSLLMSQVIGRFNHMPDLQKQHGFDLGKNQQMANHSVGLYPSLDQGGSGSMMSHDFGWFNHAPTTWSFPLQPQRSGFGYPAFGCDVVYDNSNRCPCQCGSMPEDLALQDSHDGVGDGLNF